MLSRSSSTIAATIACCLTWEPSIGQGQAELPVASAAATPSAAPPYSVVRERNARDATRPLVGVAGPAGRTTSTVSAPAHASVELESLGRGLLAVRVDDGSTTTFAVFSEQPRPVALGVLGPFASDEESRPSLVPSDAADGAIDLVASIRVADGCGVGPVAIDGLRIDAARRRATQLPRVALPATAHATSAVGADGSVRFVVDHALVADGLTTRGLDDLGDGSATTLFPTTPGRALLRGHSALIPLRIRGLRMTVRAGREGSRNVVVGVGNDRFSVAPTADAFEVVFDSPREARCVVVELDGSGASAIAELAVVPEIADDAERASQLVVELASEGPRADAAILALATLGDAAVATLSEAYGDALPAERRRMLRAAEALSPRFPDALRLFVVAIEGEDESLRDYAYARCAAMGARGLRVLSTSVRRGHPEVARVFAERAPAASLDPILERLVAGEDAERRVLHEALLTASTRDPERVRAALRTFVESDAEPRARAIALSVLTERGDVDGVSAALDVWWTRTPETTEVEIELRWLEAIGIVPIAARTPSMEAKLTAAFSDETWMVRAAAIAVGGPAHRDAIRQRLTDEVPRVRVAAIRALAEDPEARRTVAELSRRDPWPLVRLSALQVVAPLEGSDPVVRESLTERSSRVRLGLFADLQRRGDRRFIADAIGILERKRAPASVLSAAIDYLGSLCATEAEPVLVAAIEAELREDSEPRRTVATAAARALERMGSEEGVRTARRFLDPSRGGGTTPTRCGPDGNR